MDTSRFPCRVCGQFTDGIDAYVVCSDCVAEFDLMPRVEAADEELARSSPRDLVPIAPSQDEIDERVRKLLDDW